MSPAIPCPQGEEFSALLDWELAPERLPPLERHIEECEKCRAYYLRLAAADRMLGLSIGEARMLDECLAAEAGEKDAPGAALVEELENAGRTERLAALREITRRTARRRRKLLVSGLVVVVLIAAAFGVALRPSPIAGMSGAVRQKGFVVASASGGQVTLCDGARVTLAPGTVVGFRATWRWEEPWAQLVHGRITVDAGRLDVLNGNAIIEVLTGGRAEVSGKGQVSFSKAQ